MKTQRSPVNGLRSGVPGAPHERRRGTTRRSRLQGAGGWLRGWLRLLPIWCCLGAACSVWATTNWFALSNTAPASIGPMLLLSDGTVMAQNFGGNSWYRLIPDTNGSYITGTWTNMAAMNYTRLYYSAQVLQNGRVFVAGAELGTGTTNAEIYDPLSNVWTPLVVPPGLITTNNIPDARGFNTAGFLDSSSMLLPNGNVLIAPVFSVATFGTVIYDPSSNSWSAGGSSLAFQDEATWVKLPDDSILMVDCWVQGTSMTGALTTERYIPSLNQWLADATLPVPVASSFPENGPALLLPDGRAIFFGNTGHTALYTPSGTTNQGTWVRGPDLPDGSVAGDSTAAMMVNGKILLTALNNPTLTTYTYEYDYSVGTTGAFHRVSAPSGLTNNADNFVPIMLALPDGNVLYSEGTPQLYVYKPWGPPPLASAKPTISNIIPRGDGSFHLTGTLLNGISSGAAYGDDVQMDSNYPLVRLSDGAGNVYYARTYNWSSTSVRTGSRPVTTEFVLPSTLPPRVYSLEVVANGISSDPVTFSAPVWVDFNYLGALQFGTYDLPYQRLTNGVSAVATGGRISIKTAGSSAETMRLTKAMTLVSPNGTATIGR